MKDKMSDTYSTSEEHKYIAQSLKGQVGVVNPQILLTRQASSEQLSNCHLFTDDLAHSARYSYDNYYLGIKNIGQGCPAQRLKNLRQPNIFGKLSWWREQVRDCQHLCKTESHSLIRFICFVIHILIRFEQSRTYFVKDIKCARTVAFSSQAIVRQNHPKQRLELTRNG